MRPSTMPASTNSGIAFCAARWPAASPSNTTTIVFASRPSVAICSSVSAVPIGATASSMPAWCSASTSKFPSTRIAVPRPADGVQRGVQAVERLLLVEQRRLGRVDVLAVLGLGIEHAPAEADHALLAIDHRQHHAVAEEVVAAALVDADQAQTFQVGRRDLVRRQVRRQRVPARRARSRRGTARARPRRCRASRRRRARRRPAGDAYWSSKKAAASSIARNIRSRSDSAFCRACRSAGDSGRISRSTPAGAGQIVQHVHEWPLLDLREEALWRHLFRCSRSSRSSCRASLTWNEGVFSPWNGHSPFQLPLPARLSST